MPRLNTRIAPSPTGDMHLGTLRTAYFNFLAARGTGGAFILRIDDTDAARNEEKHVVTIIDTLMWLGLVPTLIVRQSQRFDIYKNVAMSLMRMGVAHRKGGAVCLHYKFPGPYVFKDLVVGDQEIGQTALDHTSDLVLLRSDGSPTYHFANCVDDIWFDIDLVIRGQDHLSNTAKHCILMRAMGVTKYPIYAHVGLIHHNGKKMSKRDGASSVLKLREDGYSPAAVLNFVLRMGWSPSEDNKANSLIPHEKAIPMFMTAGKMRASSANYDQGKLDWYQRKYAQNVQKAKEGNRGVAGIPAIEPLQTTVPLAGRPSNVIPFRLPARNGKAPSPRPYNPVETKLGSGRTGAEGDSEHPTCT